MTQTTYVNPNGLPADAQITSARDQAILARAIIRELPEYEFYWRISAIKFGKRVMRNYNTLIDRYPGADGMKTGFICASGFNLVASATRNGKRLIAVVLGSPSGGGARGEGGAAAGARLPEHGGFQLADAVARQRRQPQGAVNAEPPNLRDDMCGKKRKRPAAESESTRRMTKPLPLSRSTRLAAIVAFSPTCAAAFQALDADRRADAVDGADRGVHRRHQGAAPVSSRRRPRSQGQKEERRSDSAPRRGASPHRSCRRPKAAEAAKPQVTRRRLRGDAEYPSSKRCRPRRQPARKPAPQPRRRPPAKKAAAKKQRQAAESAKPTPPPSLGRAKPAAPNPPRSDRRRRTAAPAGRRSRSPLLTGFLGAGKTTLLNRC